MPLIDRSYFNGQLNLPQNRIGEQESLDLFIELKERDLLKTIFGYAFYKAFMAGLAETVIEQKWTDLLYGAEYTDLSGKLQKWEGLIQTNGDVVSISEGVNILELVVGRGETYDPVAGSASMTIPTSLVGKVFTIEQRGVGQLRVDEYNVADDLLTLTGGFTFTDEDTFFIRSASLIVGESTSTNKQSLIANYVYWHFLKDDATQTVGLGEVSTKAENSRPASPRHKMARAWNEMVEWNWQLWSFLWSKQTDYPLWQGYINYSGWGYQPPNIKFFQKTNAYGI